MLGLINFIVASQKGLILVIGIYLKTWQEWGHAGKCWKTTSNAKINSNSNAFLQTFKIKLPILNQDAGQR